MFLLFKQLLSFPINVVEKLHFNFLSHIASRPGGEVAVQERKIRKVSTNYSAFLVEWLLANTSGHSKGLVTTESNHSTVPFFFGGVPIVLIPQFLKGTEVHLLGLSFTFLQTNDIEVVFGNPLIHTFAQSRADAIDVIGDNFHKGNLCGIEGTKYGGDNVRAYLVKSHSSKRYVGDLRFFLSRTLTPALASSGSTRLGPSALRAYGST